MWPLRIQARAVVVLGGLVASSVWANPTSCPVVTVTADALTPPSGSLRECIGLADAGTTITFDPTVFNPGTILLAGNLPALPDDITLDGTSADRVFIDGSANPNGAGLILGNSDRVEHLTIQNCQGGGYGSGSGIWLPIPTTGNVVSNNVIRLNQGEGVFFEGNNAGNLISNNLIANNQYMGITINAPLSLCASPNQITGNIVVNGGNAVNQNDDIRMMGGGCMVIENNQISGAGGYGVKLSGGAAGVVVANNHLFANAAAGIADFGGAHDNVFEYNVVDHNAYFGVIVGDVGSSGNRILRNVIFQTPADDAGTGGLGIWLYGGADDAGILYNTVVASDVSGMRIDPSVMGWKAEDNVFAFNGLAGLDAANEPTAELQANDYFGNPGGPCIDGCQLDSLSLTVDPGFADPDAGDFTPACDGGVVDRGLFLGPSQPPSAYDGGVAYYGSGPDMGAIEVDCTPPASDAGPDGGSDAGADAGRDGGSHPLADAGADGGVIPARDAGVASPGSFGVGCGCTAGPASLSVLGLIVLAASRRRSRKT